jgi:hypothetical protein
VIPWSSWRLMATPLECPGGSVPWDGELRGSNNASPLVPFGYLVVTRPYQSLHVRSTNNGAPSTTVPRSSRQAIAWRSARSQGGRAFVGRTYDVGSSSSSRLANFRPPCEDETCSTSLRR